MFAAFLADVKERENHMIHCKKAGRTAIALVLTASFLMPVSVIASEKALQPVEDYSYYSDPAVDSDGYLCLTDNQTITDVSVRKLRMKNFDFSVPGVWAGNVVIRTLYLNQTKSSNLYKTQIRDSYVIRFFEKETWTKYHSSGYEDQENAALMGELAELRLMNSEKNDTSRWENDPMYIYFGKITKGKTEYKAFLYRPKTSEGLIDSDYASRYGYLSDINYQGCLISSFTCRNGLKLSYPNSYIENRYVSKFNADGKGMAEGSTIPDGYVPKTLLAEKNSSDEAPEALNAVSENASSDTFSWSSFSAPWTFTDRGEDYYQNLMTSIGQITVIPTVTVSPTPSVSPSATSTPTQSPVETETPAPTEVPDVTDVPEETGTPTPTPNVTSVPTNPETDEGEE